MTSTPILRALSASLVLLAFTGCTRMYYASMEKLGTEKRDILIQRVRDGKKDQDAAKEQIKTTLEAFQELTGFEGGNLEKVYKKLNSELEHAQGRADKLDSRIDSIDQVGKDLFREWQKEIDGMRDRTLKSRSTKMLRDTRTRHEQYLARMRKTEAKMQPVLQAFRDQVVFLKHNLNARAISSLKETAASMDLEVAALIKDIDASASEADSFIGSLSTSDKDNSK